MKQPKRLLVAQRYCYLLKGIWLTSNNDLQFYSISHKITTTENFNELHLWAGQQTKMMNSSVVFYQSKEGMQLAEAGLISDGEEWQSWNLNWHFTVLARQETAQLSEL